MSGCESDWEWAAGRWDVLSLLCCAVELAGWTPCVGSGRGEREIVQIVQHVSRASCYVSGRPSGAADRTDSGADSSVDCVSGSDVDLGTAC